MNFRFAATSLCSSLLLLHSSCAVNLNDASDSHLSSSWIEDLVQELPDYGKPPTPHFSGYLDGSEGCNTEVNGPLCQVHYWFALAEEDSANAPVVLWLNGGEYCSSICKSIFGSLIFLHS